MNGCIQNKWIGKIFTIPLILLAVLLSLYGCQKQTPLKIGVIGTMSGANADLSVSGRRGIELAVDILNRSGGIDGKLIEIVVKDDQNNPDEALLQQHAFVEEGIQLVIGHFTSGMVLSVLDYVNSQDMLLLGPTISADSLSGKDDHFIRFIASTKEQAKALSAYAISKNEKRIAMVYDSRNKGFTDELVDNYKEKMITVQGSQVDAFPYDPSVESEVKTIVDSLVISKPDALVILASAEDCAKMAQQIKSLLPSPQLYAPLWANTPELIRKGGSAVNGMIIVGALDNEDLKPEFNTFKTQFKERYGEEPTFASVYAYETVMSLAKAIKVAGSTEPDKVKASLLKIKTYEGMQSVFELDENGDNTRMYFLFEINEGLQRKVD